MSVEGELKSISMQWDLPHPPEKVWRALTEPALVAQWLMPNDMPAQTGQPFTFRQEPTAWWDGIVHSEILELEPQKRLRYRWNSKVGQGGLGTEVTWVLSPSAQGTKLELLHSGFKPTDAQAFAGAGKGWDLRIKDGMAAVLSKLNTH